MTKPKKNIFESLTLRSFDTFIQKVDEFGFDFSYIYEDNRDNYLKGKKKYEHLQEIAKTNQDFQEIFLIKEELHKHSDKRSTKHVQLKDELDSIRLTLQ